MFVICRFTNIFILNKGAKMYPLFFSNNSVFYTDTVKMEDQFLFHQILQNLRQTEHNQPF